MALVKDMGKGMQPASLSPVSTELRIHGTDHKLTIPCVTSTKVIEIKEMLCHRLGVDPESLGFVTRQGCAFRKQYDHEEVGRKVTITGIPSFERQKQTYTEPFVIIGAGHVGLRHGLFFLKNKFDNFVIYDRRHKVGGTSWIAQANKTSKLQTELGTYHLQYDEAYSVPKNMSTWPSRDDLLRHFAEVTEEYGLMPYIRLNTNVKHLEFSGKDTSPGPMKIQIEKTDGAYGGVLPPPPTGEGCAELDCAAVFMYPGNLSHPRKEEYKGEDSFGGDIIYAMFDNYDYGHTTGQDVVIVGHGAFAVENVRTCCEYSAGKIYMVCRRRNLACSRVTSWLCNQSDPAMSAAMFLHSLGPMYGLTPWDPWDYHSVISNQARTNVTINQTARFGIGDVYFLSLYMRKLEVIDDRVKRLSHHMMHLESGRKVGCAVILKLLGLTGDFEVDRLMKVKEMQGFWANGDSRRYIASEGPGVSAANFGGTSLSPGAIVWVEQGTHMLWYPKDWQILSSSNMLPLHKAEPDIGKPSYVLDARLQTAMNFVIPACCPIIAEHTIGYGVLKKNKQLECHPMEKFLEEASAEWDEYGKAWKAQMPTLLDPPPYPYTRAVVTDLLHRNAKSAEEAAAAAAAKAH